MNMKVLAAIGSHLGKEVPVASPFLGILSETAATHKRKNFIPVTH